MIENKPLELIDVILSRFCAACKEAAINDKEFDVFKQNENIKVVLEHCSKEIGQNYKDLIFENNPHLLHNFKSFLENDKYGNPTKENFGEITCSPSTLQYIGVLSNLIDKFELIGAKIIEIGGGYGGQCKIINDYYDLNEYHIVDLAEVGMLQNKYLNKFGGSGYSSKPLFEVFTPFSYRKQEYDLFISNYALSELTSSQQIDYIVNIALNCKHGYITCNATLNGAELLMEKFASYKVSSDIKGERETNYIITW